MKARTTLLFSLLGLAFMGAGCMTSYAPPPAAPAPTVPDAPEPTPAPAPAPTPVASTRLPLGKISEFKESDCPASFQEGTCARARVSCPATDAVVAKLHLTGTGTSGTLLLTTGDLGTGFYGAGGEAGEEAATTEAAMAAMRAEGLRLIEVAWEKPGVWEASGSISAGCRFATLASFLEGKYHEKGLFMAQGNSGGASQIAFALAYYGLGDLFDLANMSGGPPPCPLTGDGVLNRPVQDTCIGGAGVWDASREPLLSGAPEFSYAKTTVNFFIGAEEPTPAIVTTAKAFHAAITSAKSYTTIPNVGHQVQTTKEGSDAMLAAVRAALGKK